MEESRDIIKGSPGGPRVKEDLTWIPGKIVECGTAVGVTVHHIPSGWDGAVKFVVERERHNMDENFNSKPKMKGVRERQNLSSSINYNKSREGKQEGNSSSLTGERKRKGEMSSCK